MSQIYNRGFLIPANTSKSNPLKSDIILPNGIITKITLGFAWGVAWLAGISLWRYNHQIVPSELGTWITGNETVFSFDVSIAIITEPFSISLYGFNEDELYDHTIQVGITLNESILSNPVPLSNPNEGNNLVKNIIQRAKGIK